MSATLAPDFVGYRLVRALSRALLGLFYRRIDVVGAEQLPLAGPLIVAANHHNSVVDAMLLVAVSPRRLRTLANAPLFRHPFIGPFLRLIGALPVHRRQEAGDDRAKNTALFAATTATLREGGAILIFPEGRTQPEPVLLTLRTGAARMLLAAEAEVTLLPVGLVYHEPGTFRDGRALVSIGTPVETRDAVVLARTEPERAARQLTESLTERLQGEIVEADDWATLRLVGLAEELWRQQHPKPQAPDEKARVEWLQGAMSRYKSLLAREPARIQAFRQQLEEYDREERRGGRERRFETPAAAIGECLLLLLGAPLALAGIAAHVIPYQLTGWVVKKLDRTAEEEATDKIAAGFLFYPLAWAVEAWLVHRGGGGWAAVAFLASLLPTGFFALAWQERLDRFVREARAFAAFLKDPDLPRRLAERRRRLVTELDALASMTAEGRQP